MCKLLSHIILVPMTTNYIPPFQIPIAVTCIKVEPAVKYSFVFKSMQTKLMGQYNAQLACVHPPSPLQKIVLSRRFFLEGGDDGCDTGYARLTLLPCLHVKPLQCQIDPFASFVYQTADICNNSYYYFIIVTFQTNCATRDCNQQNCAYTNS